MNSQKWYRLLDVFVIINVNSEERSFKLEMWLSVNGNVSGKCYKLKIITLIIFFMVIIWMLIELTQEILTINFLHLYY
ncbi:hypothetical protein Phpb_02215 [Photorhabdus namnaonensis]|uniref:Uncharacterized protein n=1 Tax=Photorhabdus namnaonensis TaxID=1851568 RepID=A0A1B8YID8_9GAMM|nr:hypothetical protein Phpb_02215 [Photorhabdus namnaonensis]